MIKFDGPLAGVVGSTGAWTFEGTEYDTPASADDLVIQMGEALAAPDEKQLASAQTLVFGPGTTYTSQALLAIREVYEREVGIDGDGSAQILGILSEAARRIACIEALTI
jgi:hypothetical protein